MTKRRLYTLSLLLLLLTTPWLFSGVSATTVMGFPPWALYSLLATLVYAVTVALLMQRYWDHSGAAPVEADLDEQRDESGEGGTR